MKNKQLQKQLRMKRVISMDANDVRESYRTAEPSKIRAWTIVHSSLFKAVWDWVILMLVIYTAIFTPYVTAFTVARNGARKKGGGDVHRVSDINDPITWVEFFVDAMFIIDIAINFRTTFVDHNFDRVDDPLRIASNYLRGWFIVDLLGAIPFQLLIMIGNTDQHTTIISLLKVARLLRVGRVVFKLDRYSEYGIVIVVFLMGAFTLIGIATLAKSATFPGKEIRTFRRILIGHWLACIWYAIGVGDEGNDQGVGWLSKLAEDLNKPYNATSADGGASTKDAYLTALYFILTCLTSVGFGNVYATTNNEKIFSIITMLIGALTHAVIFGNVAAIIQRIQSFGTTHYHSKMNKVRQFIRFNAIPSPLRHRLKQYARYEYTYTNGINMNKVLQNFPEGTQKDICVHLTGHLLSSDAFKSVTPGCRRSLSLKLRTTHSLVNDFVIVPGDVINDVFWVRRGMVEVIVDDVRVLTLAKGDSFGENFGLTYKNYTPGKSKASIRALSNCDFHSITREDLLEIMTTYPEFQEAFNNDMQVTYNLRQETPEYTDTDGSMTSSYTTTSSGRTTPTQYDNVDTMGHLHSTGDVENIGDMDNMCDNHNIGDMDDMDHKANMDHSIDNTNNNMDNMDNMGAYSDNTSHPLTSKSRVHKTCGGCERAHRDIMDIKANIDRLESFMHDNVIDIINLINDMQSDSTVDDHDDVSITSSEYYTECLLGDETAVTAV